MTSQRVSFQREGGGGGEGRLGTIVLFLSVRQCVKSIAKSYPHRIQPHYQFSGRGVQGRGGEVEAGHTKTTTINIIDILIVHTDKDIYTKGCI